MSKSINSQLVSLRDTALRLSISSGNIFHCEIGIKGELDGLYYCDGAENGKLSAEKFDGVLQKFFNCKKNDSQIIVDPFTDQLFDFNNCNLQKDVSEVDESNLLSCVIGEKEEIERFCRLIASPMVKYLRRYADLPLSRDDSYYDEDVLSEWVYFMYDIGLKHRDPNLIRCYRLLTFTEYSKTDIDAKDVIEGYSDTEQITMGDFDNSTQWELFCSAVNRKEMAYSKLSTDLFMASRITLDYLIDMEFSKASSEFGKKVVAKRSCRAVKIEKIKKELIRYLKSAKDHALEAESNDKDMLLKRPSKSELAKMVGVKSYDISRCFGDDPQLKALYDMLDSVGKTY